MQAFIAGMTIYKILYFFFEIFPSLLRLMLWFSMAKPTSVTSAAITDGTSGRRKFTKDHN